MEHRPGLRQRLRSIGNASTRTVLTDPGGSTANGTPLQMGADSGDLSYPWRVSYHHYMTG